MTYEPNRFDYTYMAIAREIAGRLSYAERKKVAAIIVKNDSILSFGFNGTPSGDENVCEDVGEFAACSCQMGRRDSVEPCSTAHRTKVVDGNRFCASLVTKPSVIHAEMNAINKMARSTESCFNADMYITLSPCYECAKSIHSCGIKRVFYGEEYRITDGIDFLRGKGVEVIYLQNDKGS